MARKLIGASTHSLDEARQAQSSGADFVLFGPVYFTPSKASFGAPQGLDALKENSGKLARARLCYSSGIKPENIIDVHSVGRPRRCAHLGDYRLGPTERGCNHDGANATEVNAWEKP